LTLDPAIRDHLPAGPLHFVSQPIGEPIIMTVVVKEDSTTITSRDDVVDRTWELQTRRPGHCEALSTAESTSTGASFYRIENRKPSPDPGEAPPENRKPSLRKRRDKPAWG